MDGKLKHVLIPHQIALRACIIENKGDCNPESLTKLQTIMRSLWEELSAIADFDKVWKKLTTEHRQQQEYNTLRLDSANPSTHRRDQKKKNHHHIAITHE